MRVRDAYRPETITVGVDEPLATAARLMSEENIGALAVVGGEAIGIISERDIVRAVTDAVDLFATPVHAYASFDVYTADLEDDTSDVAYQMLHSGIRHLPVVEQDKVIGMVSMRDVLAVEAWA